MVHISDGVLAEWLWGGGWAVTAIILAYALSKMKTEDVPRLSVITAAVFVSSLIHLSIGPTSVHFILNGFAGVMLGILAYPCIFVALVLQCFLFGHGGVTTIGINTVNMGVPALVAYLIFRAGTGLDIRPETKSVASLFGAIAGGVGVVLALLFLAVELITTGEEFIETTVLVMSTHVPIIAVEAIFTGVIVGFIATVEPELFGKK
ncbi:MAG: cobalt transporter CbiM [Methanosarcinales archaeon]|nr:MAG: cobalt transporter CbiM [Methanosarcinales archaeon]